MSKTRGSKTTPPIVSTISSDPEESLPAWNNPSDPLPAWNNPSDPWQFLPFCAIPGEQEDYVVNNCKADSKNEEWAKVLYGARQNGKDITFYDRPLQGECGPHCRPTCVTLMLDLDKLDYINELRCVPDDLCDCSHKKIFQCGEERLENLFDEYPKCYLETADCLGPTLFDDVVAHAEWQDSQILDLGLDHCTNIPDDDLYCRFKEWDLVTPIERYSCEDGDYPECLNRERKIYWEYCNIVEEDPFCDADENCKQGDRCGQKCDKRTEPFANGWTTFTVTGSIPVDPILNVDEARRCDDRLDFAYGSKSACFMQRVEFFFPDDDEGCGIGCPNCHECPLLSLGDKFGPLEVVGFGHCLHSTNEDHTCSSCDQVDFKTCEKGCELDCDDLFDWSCEESVDCHTNTSIGFFNFESNQCSWGVGEIPQGYIPEPTRTFTEINQAQSPSYDKGGLSGTGLATMLIVLNVAFLALYATRRMVSNQLSSWKGRFDAYTNSSKSEMTGITIAQKDEATTNPIEVTLPSSTKGKRQPLRQVGWLGEVSEGGPIEL